MIEFDWKEYFQLAEELKNSANRKLKGAKLRSATSRAYYAVFCTARDIAKVKLEYERNKDNPAHKDLIEFLRFKGYEELAQDMERLRDWRNDCDYKTKLKNLELIVTGAMITAENLLDNLSKI